MPQCVLGYAALGVVDPSGLDQFDRYLLDRELMAEEVEVHPGLGAAALLAAKELAVEGSDALEVRGGEGEVEGGSCEVVLAAEAA
jgi:hypothetical protein